MIIKCKMCGGDLNFAEGVTVCECEYCGSKQTIPSVDDEKKATLYNRANKLRMNSEFDKAQTVYEQIVADFPEEAEAYWGLCLCKFGIEYVEDIDGSRKPTCHRTVPTSIFDDADFENVMEYADRVAKSVYRTEAKEIERVQRRILEVAQSEEPYDVFICYKETDEAGSRTEDSVLAQGIYDALTEKGLKVFFARITLESKLGSEYEPYIYAALSSAEVMLTIGTDYDYFSAVWVKNEWSRYLAMMKNDRKKSLIPCYKGMDAYDLPREFKNLQAQDMGKLGWMQDLVRGVLKLCGKEEPKAIDSANAPATRGMGRNGTTIDSLLQRCFIFLEDRKWGDADIYAEKVLDMDPKCAKAYMVKLCSELKVSSFEKLGLQDYAFFDKDNYQKAIRFASVAEKKIYEMLSISAKKNEYDRLERERKAMEDNRRNEEVRKKREAEQAYAAKYAELKKIITFLKSKQVVAKETAETLLRDTQEKIIAINDALQENKQQISAHLANVEEALKKAKEHEADAAECTMQAQLSLATLSGLKKIMQGKSLQSAVDEARRVEQNAKEKVKKLEKTVEEVKRSLSNVGNEESKEIQQLRLREKALGQKLEELALIDKNPVKAAEAFLKSGISYGKYPKSENGESESISWHILDIVDDAMLVISEYGIDAKRFHHSNMYPTWERSDIRNWLNGEFFSKAFSLQEQDGIIAVNVSTPSYNGNSGGDDTNDRIWLLSREETEQYLNNGDVRKIDATAYAHMHGADTNTEGCWWWLRSPSKVDTAASCVSGYGRLDFGYVNRSSGAVRPACWISLDSISL